MERHDGPSTHELMEHLPPIDKAPILAHLARLGMRRFQTEYALETPVDDNGLVDHEVLVEKVSGLVDPDYRWQAPFFDEHHLYWYDHRYNTSFRPDQELAVEFRDLPINKLWVPRQFHNFVHAVTMPSEVPEHDVMQKVTKDYRRRSYLYQIATEAIMLRENMEGVEQFVTQKGEVHLINPKTRRAYKDLDGMEERRRHFITQIEQHHKRGLIDLSTLAPMDLIDRETIEMELPMIRSSVIIQPLIRTKGDEAIAVKLPFRRITVAEESAA